MEEANSKLFGVLKIFHACYVNKFDLFFVALQQFVNLC